jgi:hypothetical protein
VSRVLWVLIMATLGCKRANKVDVDTELSIADYLGLADERSWTFRDDGDASAPPDEADLLRGRPAYGVTLDIRRGGRWMDGETEMLLTFFVDTHLSVVTWDVNGSAGEGDLPMGYANPANGQSVSDNDWFCATQTGALLSTYYGVFDDIVQFECSGGAGPAGHYTFARDVGLVHFEGRGTTLDLVAPW